MLQTLTNSPFSVQNYLERFHRELEAIPLDALHELAEMIREAWRLGHQIFICGNGGSAASACHLANDLVYGVNPGGQGIRAHALAANTAVMTCLANDESYEDIFAMQLMTLAKPEDILIVISGSGNSPNVVRALETARVMGVKTAALLGFSGGACKALTDCAVHCEVDDMQMAEDLHMIAGHILTRMLRLA